MVSPELVPQDELTQQIQNPEDTLQSEKEELIDQVDQVNFANDASSEITRKLIVAAGALWVANKLVKSTTKKSILQNIIDAIMKLNGSVVKNFAFGREDPNAVYGLYEIVDDRPKLIANSTNKNDLFKKRSELVAKVTRKIPKYVVRKVSNLWTFAAKSDDLFSQDEREIAGFQLFDAIRCLEKYAKNKKQKDIFLDLYRNAEDAMDSIDVKAMNFTELEDAETSWVPPEELFAKGSSREIADEVHKSHDSLRSGMACLNFYLNRGGENIPDDRRKVIEEAKELLREMYN